jgi:hypothetical protein
MSKNPVHHKRTKHIELDIHFVRERVQIGQLRVLHVPTGEQYADVMTKGLPTRTFEAFRDSLCVIELKSAKTAGGGVIQRVCALRLTLVSRDFPALCRPRPASTTRTSRTPCAPALRQLPTVTAYGTYTMDQHEIVVGSDL